MATASDLTNDFTELLTDLARSQAEAATALFGQIAPRSDETESGKTPAVQWAEVAQRMQTLWLDYQGEQIEKLGAGKSHYSDPTKWIATAQAVMQQLPLSDPATQERLWNETIALAETVLGQFGLGPKADEAGEGEPDLPRRDRRFADPAWRAQPFYAVLHQAYLMLSEQMIGMAERANGLEPARKMQLVFATRALIDTLSPSNFPLTNPVAMERAVETRGQSLVKGMENLIADLRRGQLTHTDPAAFTLGENIAVTPGKVVHETPLYQVIQYTPTTDKVLKTPLVIFPPWINRFYILDLNAKKSFVRWAVEQGISVFMVSWKSADETMAQLTWDDYIDAQVQTIDFVRDRLNVPSVHAIGYCVAGTTLAATLAMLARRGEEDKVASATFFTAQVDFEDAGDLKVFVEDSQIDTIAALSPEGYLDGRYLAATFNMLRGNDLIWSYVEKNYLKGEDHPAFDLLHWNGDVTNLPTRWHRAYLRELYRDNRLVVPDSLSACGVPLDLRKITTPCFIQAGKEDHIAPPRSVWKLTRHLQGPWTFMLAGSGHIAGVVNPPSAGKYQYWTNDGQPETLDAFISGAKEHPGSWWPYWAAWLVDHDATQVAAKGKRRPGHSKKDPVIEDAPGRYVSMR